MQTQMQTLEALKQSLAARRRVHSLEADVLIETRKLELREAFQHRLETAQGTRLDQKLINRATKVTRHADTILQRVETEAESERKVEEARENANVTMEKSLSFFVKERDAMSERVAAAEAQLERTKAIRVEQAERKKKIAEEIAALEKERAELQDVMKFAEKTKREIRQIQREGGFELTQYDADGFDTTIQLQSLPPSCLVEDEEEVEELHRDLIGYEARNILFGPLRVPPDPMLSVEWRYLDDEGQKIEGLRVLVDPALPTVDDTNDHEILVPEVEGYRQIVEMWKPEGEEVPELGLRKFDLEAAKALFEIPPLVVNEMMAGELAKVGLPAPAEDAEDGKLKIPYSMVLEAFRSTIDLCRNAEKCRAELRELLSHYFHPGPYGTSIFARRKGDCWPHTQRYLSRDSIFVTVRLWRKNTEQYECRVVFRVDTYVAVLRGSVAGAIDPANAEVHLSRPDDSYFKKREMHATAMQEKMTEKLRSIVTEIEDGKTDATLCDIFEAVVDVGNYRRGFPPILEHCVQMGDALREDLRRLTLDV